MKPYIYANRENWLENRSYRWWEYRVFLVIAILCWLVLVAAPIAWFLGYKIFTSQTWLWVLEVTILIVAYFFTRFANSRYNDIMANKQVYEDTCSKCPPEKNKECSGNC